MKQAISGYARGIIQCKPEYNPSRSGYAHLNYISFFIQMMGSEQQGAKTFDLGRNQAMTLKVKVSCKLNDQVQMFLKQSYAN